MGLAEGPLNACAGENRNPKAPSTTARKSGRVVEGTGLENQQRGNPFVGSNPTSSADLCLLWAERGDQA
jgi:hypothetical protein